jgi:hypothetical protein
MGSVLNVEAFKLVLAYRRPLVGADRSDQGQASADLPLRQYYWASNVGGSPDSPTSQLGPAQLYCRPIAQWRGAPGSSLFSSLAQPAAGVIGTMPERSLLTGPPLPMQTS